METRQRADRDHFARPVGGFTTATKPYTCSVCGRPVERRGIRPSQNIWRHSETPAERQDRTGFSFPTDLSQAREIATQEGR